MRVGALTGILLGLAASVASAAPSPKTNDSAQPHATRRNAWSVGFTGLRHALKAGDGNELTGNGGDVQFGRGYIGDSWFGDATLDILLGPFDPTFDRQFNVDYLGTGATVTAGFSAQSKSLRSAEGGYGFALSLSYADIVGHSIGKNRQDSGLDRPEDRALPSDYTMRVTYFSLTPSIFFAWLEPPRPAGNTPDLLTTRVEGYFLNLGVSMPLLASYQAKQTVGDQQVTESGQLRGYSIVVGLSAMLGT